MTEPTEDSDTALGLAVLAVVPGFFLLWLGLDWQGRWIAVVLLFASGLFLALGTISMVVGGSPRWVLVLSALFVAAPVLGVLLFPDPAVERQQAIDEFDSPEMQTKICGFLSEGDQGWENASAFITAESGLHGRLVDDIWLDIARDHCPETLYDDDADSSGNLGPGTASLDGEVCELIGNGASPAQVADIMVDVQGMTVEQAATEVVRIVRTTCPEYESLLTNP